MADPAMRKKCPFIQMFLKEKHSLFATQYLPDIIELQQRVGELYVHRLSKYEATNITIQKFLENGGDFSSQTLPTFVHLSLLLLQIITVNLKN